MCCLGYENENYREMRSKLPRNGQWVSTAQGMAKVVDSNPLKQTVFVELESRARVEFPVSDVKIETRPENKPQDIPRREGPPGGQAPQNRPPARPREDSQPGGQAPR